jgi:uncharacterized protein YjdB
VRSKEEERERQTKHYALCIINYQLFYLFSNHLILFIMKKKNVFNCIAAATMLLGTTAAANAQTWYCGSPTAANVTATLSGGTLTISGTGAMYNYTTTPWYSERASITTVVIEEGVTTIGENAFSYSRVTSATIPGSVTAIGNYAFISCSRLTSVTIPNAVTSIGNSAFYGCSGLTSVTIGSAVTTIDAGAFSGCSGLTSVYNYRTTPQTIDASVFTNVTLGNVDLYVPATAVSAYQEKDVWKTFKEVIAIVPVTSVSLSESTLALTTVGGTATLTATVEPNNATKQNVAWTSDNTAVATVNSEGVVTPVAAGTANITATTEEGGFTETCAVTVRIAVTGVSLNENMLALKVGDTETLTETVLPTDATNKVVAWSSSNAAVATVSSAGLVTAVAAGTANIIAATQDGGFADTCAVTVSNIDVTGVSLNKSTLSLAVGGSTETLTAIIAPANATIQTVTWSSSDDAVATVSAGVITAVAAGTVAITVTTDDGDFTASCAVTIVRALSNDVATLQALVIRLLTDSIALRTTISDLQMQLGIAQNDNSSLQTQLNTANSTIAAVRDSVGTLKGQLSTAQSDNSNLQAQLSTANTTITAVRDSVGTLQSSNSGLQTQLSTANSTITAVRDSVSGLQTQLSTAQSANSNLQAQLSTANTTIATVRDSVSGLQTQLSVANADIATLTQDLNTCKAGGGTTAVAAPVTALLKVYPNPVQNGELIIDDPQLETDGKVEIYNVNGGLVETRRAASLQGGTITINIGHLPAGIYIVKVGNKAAKIVVND